MQVQRLMIAETMHSFKLHHKNGVMAPSGALAWHRGVVVLASAQAAYTHFQWIFRILEKLQCVESVCKRELGCGCIDVLYHLWMVFSRVIVSM